MHNNFIGVIVMKDKQRKKNSQGEHLEYNTGMTPVEGGGKGKRIQQKSLE